MELVAYSYEPAQIKDLELDFLRVSDENAAAAFASSRGHFRRDVGYRESALDHSCALIWNFCCLLN